MMVECGEPPEHKFNDVMDVLVRVYGITPSARRTFLGRVQQMQKALPGFGGVGRGQKRLYGQEDMLLLAIVFDWVDLGLTPAGITAAINTGDGEDKHEAFRLSVRKALQADQPLVITCAALASLRSKPVQPQIVVGQPKDPRRFGPYAIAFPAMRNEQVGDAIASCKLEAFCTGGNSR